MVEKLCFSHRKNYEKEEKEREKKKKKNTYKLKNKFPTVQKL